MSQDERGEDTAVELPEILKLGGHPLAADEVRLTRGGFTQIVAGLMRDRTIVLAGRSHDVFSLNASTTTHRGKSSDAVQAFEKVNGKREGFFVLLDNGSVLVFDLTKAVLIP